MVNGIKDLSSQTEVVVKQLVRNEKVDINTAINMWYTSKTKQILEKNGLFYVSGMRCYYELILEKNKSPEWMREPFE